MMFFSVVIPTYNRETTISRAIDSILAQTFTQVEIIVVDDGSTDNTADVISKYPSLQVRYFKTENRGVAHARNYGIKRASGQYIGFLDSDDFYEKDHLFTAYAFITQKKDPEVVHLNFLWGPDDKSTIHKNQLPAQLPRDIFKSCSLHVNCIFIRQSVFKTCLFNESRELMFAEDWDFFIKLAVHFPICLFDHTSAYLTDHEDRSMRSFNEEKWRLRRNAIELSLLQDDMIKASYHDQIKVVVAHMNSLIAINLAVRKFKKGTLSYWLLALSQNPKELMSRRSAAILKHLLFSW